MTACPDWCWTIDRSQPSLCAACETRDLDTLLVEEYVDRLVRAVGVPCASRTAPGRGIPHLAWATIDRVDVWIGPHGSTLSGERLEIDRLSRREVMALVPWAVARLFRLPGTWTLVAPGNPIVAS